MPLLSFSGSLDGFQSNTLETSVSLLKNFHHKTVMIMTLMKKIKTRKERKDLKMLGSLKQMVMKIITIKIDLISRKINKRIL